MSVRDPDTGQFLAASAAQTVDRAYEDFDVQLVRLVLDFTGQTQGLADTIDGFHVSEPLGGLQRDELAELVGFSTRVSNLPSNGTAGTCEQTFSGEMSFDAESHLIDPADAVETLDVGDQVDVDRLAWEQESDPDVLDHWAVEGAMDRDDTNGNALGFVTTYERDYQYRPMFGRGPVLDRHNDLFWHLRYNTAGGAEAQGAMTWHTTLVWDVFSRGQG